MSSFNLLKRSVRLFALSVFAFNALALPAFAIGTDTDGDHILDDDETLYGWDLNNADENGNGVIDGEDDYEGDGLITQSELYLYSTDPTNLDTDGDGRGDYNELFVAPTSDPTDADSDDDGLGDYAEFVTYGTDPENPDTDGDGLGDYYEEITLTDAGFPVSGSTFDSDGDGTSDGGEDFDSDGLTNVEEKITYHTDPIIADTDGDGALDGDEVAAGTDPLVSDLADLLIDSVTYNSDTSISFVVRNAGTADVGTAEFPYLNFYYDFFNSDLSTSYSASYLIDDHGTEYRTVDGSTTVNSGPSADPFPSCVLYVLAVADGNGDVFESNDSNNEYRTTLDLCPGDGEVVNGFTVEAGIDEGIGMGSTYNLAAYTEGASSLTSATVDWGDGSAIESTTQTVDGDRINLGASHLYGYFETFTVTVCANDGSEEVCDTLHLSIVGSSSSESSSGGSSVTLAGDDDETTTTDTTTTPEGTDGSTDESTDSSTEENDPEVILSGDEEAADCSAMMFEDVSEDDDFYDAICEMWAADVVHGKTATLFDTEDTIRRDEAAKIFTRLFGYVTEAYGETPAIEESSFVDVEASDPLSYYAEVAVQEELMSADTDTVEDETGEVVEEATFMPHDAMTAGEIANTLEVILGSNEAGEALDAQDYEVDSTMTRGGFLQFLFTLVD